MPKINTIARGNERTKHAVFDRLESVLRKIVKVNLSVLESSED